MALFPSAKALFPSVEEEQSENRGMYLLNYASSEQRFIF